MDIKRFYIYRIINIENGHDYIGRKRESNTRSPLNDNYWGSGTLIKEAIQKYGKQNFRKEIIEYGLTYEDAVNREVFWIQKFRDEGKGYYNISPGLEGFGNRDIIDNKYLTEYNEHISEKVKNDWKNMSEQDYLKRTGNMKIAWENRTPEDKEDFSKKRSIIQKEVYSNMSEEERQTANNKRINSLKEMHKNRSDEYKKEINDKISKKLIDYNKSLTIDDKMEISKKLSLSQKEYLLRETDEHRKARSINQSLAQGKYYKLIDPDGNEFIIKALNFWCRQTFGDKGPSANTAFREKGFYKGYKFLGEYKSPESEK